MKLSTLGLKLAALVAGLGLFTVARSVTPAKGSLSDLEIEYSELKMTLEKVLGENQKLTADLAETREALTATQKSLADMRKFLALATGESEVFKRQAGEYRLRIDALGLESAGGNTSKLEQRYMTALSDLRITVDEKKKLSEAIVRLSEAASIYAKTATGATAESRLGLEAEVRNANLALGLNSPYALEATPVPATMSDGAVISLKDELALVVMNLGSQHGVKVGMPFQVIRDGRLIGTVRTVDVREKISGATIQNLSSEKDRIRVGDRLKVDARQ